MRRRVQAQLRVMMRFVEPLDSKAGKILYLLSDKAVADVFRFLRPIELVSPLRLVSRSFARIPTRWFVEAKLPIPAPPKSTFKFIVAPTAPTDATFLRMLAKRKLKLGPFLGKGLGGTVMKLIDTPTNKESSTYVVKIASFADDIEGLNDFRVHKHLMSTVPDCVPIVYDSAMTGKAMAILMERMGNTFSNVRGRRCEARIDEAQRDVKRRTGKEVPSLEDYADYRKSLPSLKDRLLATEWMTLDEQAWYRVNDHQRTTSGCHALRSATMVWCSRIIRASRRSNPLWHQARHCDSSRLSVCLRHLHAIGSRSILSNKFIQGVAQ